MDDLEQQYRALVERVRGYPMPEAARAAILAETGEAYRRELAEQAGDTPTSYPSSGRA